MKRSLPLPPHPLLFSVCAGISNVLSPFDALSSSSSLLLKVCFLLPLPLTLLLHRVWILFSYRWERDFPSLSFTSSCGIRDTEGKGQRKERRLNKYSFSSLSTRKEKDRREDSREKNIPRKVNRRPSRINIDMRRRDKSRGTSRSKELKGEKNQDRESIRGIWDGGRRRRKNETRDDGGEEEEKREWKESHIEGKEKTCHRRRLYSFTDHRNTREGRRKKENFLSQRQKQEYHPFFSTPSATEQISWERESIWKRHEETVKDITI